MDAYRPKLIQWNDPVKKEYFPRIPIGAAGQLVDTNAGWRSVRPVIIGSECINCNLCFLYCPEGCISKNEPSPSIDLDYCKGCGICAYECKSKAISMVKEEG